METKRLYYDDAYQRAFQARVVDQTAIDGQPAVALDRTCFFPASGGQPHDTGRLDEVAVVDVRQSNGRVWHLMQRPLEGQLVDGEILWPRRWDHMQNHSGQHILSQAFIVAADALTVAWRLSANSLTVDLDRPLSESDLARAEQLANAVVQENRPIRARVVDEAELASLALRKQPQVDGRLRIVEIADFDRVACSGTHVSSTAQVGLIKILRAERQGRETRIHFVCGGRALADYASKHQMVRALATRFTRGEDEILEAIAKLQEEAQTTRRELRAARDALVETEAERLWAQAEASSPPRLVQGLYPEWPADQIKRLALALRNRPGCTALLAGGAPPQVFFARSADQAVDLGQVMRSALAAAGGRGGGRGDYAQGSTPDLAAAQQAIDLAASALANREEP